MPITYENTDRLVRFYGSKLRKLSPSPSLTGYLIAFGLGVVVGGILVYGPTRSAVVHAVAKSARVTAEKVEEWAAA